jgi:hypothetical protein
MTLKRSHNLRDVRNIFSLRNEVAPRPGFEPGSSGRQPLILDRTILPGLSWAKGARWIMQILII